ncbi:MAG: PIN domain-containing protein [Candidatus Bathyarchaeia archaeon]|nr:type II toxin-antitoxin system VapC family toxin [Candidatus Bathyarchaeota archaeon]
MLLIDTNVFLELFLGQEKAEDCERLLEKVSKGEMEATVTKFTIHATEAILNDSSLILAFIRNLQNSLGLNIYETSLEDELASSMLMNSVKLDFGDALQYYVAKKLGVEAIISYDRHFDKLDVTRKEPADLLGVP